MASWKWLIRYSKFGSRTPTQNIKDIKELNFISEFIFLPPISWRRRISQLAVFESFTKNSAKRKIQSSKAKIKIHLRAKKCKGGRKSFYLGIFWRHQRECADIYRFFASLQSLWIRRGRLHSHGQSRGSQRLPLPRSTSEKCWKSCSKVVRHLSVGKTSSWNVQRLEQWQKWWQITK